MRIRNLSYPHKFESLLLQYIYKLYNLRKEKHHADRKTAKGTFLMTLKVHLLFFYRSATLKVSTLIHLIIVSKEYREAFSGNRRTR